MGSKSKVNTEEDPSNKASTPRRELMAAVLEVKLALEFDSCNLVKKKTIFRSDDKAVLAYLKNMKITVIWFEREKVKKILRHTDNYQWQYISTNVNPAD